MANIRIRQALEKIDNELAHVVAHVVQYSGIDPKDALFVENAASGICEAAARLVQIAKEAQGVRNPNTKTKVRKALGYTYP